MSGMKGWGFYWRGLDAVDGVIFGPWGMGGWMDGWMDGWCGMMNA